MSCCFAADLSWFGLGVEVSLSSIVVEEVGFGSVWRYEEIVDLPHDGADMSVALAAMHPPGVE